jgi:hypothetical protein
VSKSSMIISFYRKCHSIFPPNLSPLPVDNSIALLLGRSDIIYYHFPIILEHIFTGTYHVGI